MAILIKDKDLDEKLMETQRSIKHNFGISCSKTDAIRFLLEMKKQGKKTNKKWKSMF